MLYREPRVQRIRVINKVSVLRVSTGITINWAPPRSTTVYLSYLNSSSAPLVMQESVHFAFKNPCRYHFQGRRLIKRDCNSDKCVTSTTYDIAAQDTTATQGNSVPDDDQEGAQDNTSTCAYHFPFRYCSRVPEGSPPELGMILRSRRAELVP